MMLVFCRRCLLVLVGWVSTWLKEIMGREEGLEPVVASWPCVPQGIEVTFEEGGQATEYATQVLTWITCLLMVGDQG